MKIKMIVVGKIKEKYWTDAINEYKKRISAFCDLNLIEVKEVNTDDIGKNINDEGSFILNNIKEDDFIITLEILGKEYSSEELAGFIKKHYTYDNRVLTFIIGGSNGLSNEVISKSNLHLSFGKSTYPHQLMRVILLEQLYRAMMINNNRSYHK
mgnify:FL=1